MKTNNILISAIFFLMIFAQTASALYSVSITPDNGSRPFQFNLTLSNASGTNNITNVFLNGHGSVNFTDVYFTDASGNLLNHYRESNTTGKHWINLTTNGSFTLWYGNASHVDSSNGSLTFPSFCCSGNAINTSQWTTSGTPTVSNGVLTLNAVGENIYSTQNYNSGYAMEANITASATNGFFSFGWGTCNVCVGWNLDTINVKYAETRNTTVTETALGAYGTTANHFMVIWKNSTNAQFYYNNVILATHSTNIPASSINASFKVLTLATYTIQNAFVRNHPTPLPAITSVGAEQQIVFLPIIASSNIKYSNDSSASTTASVITKMKEIRLTENYNGSWKINFDAVTFSSGTSNIRIYKNSVPYGSLQGIGISFSGTISETFNNILIFDSDVIELWGNRGTTAAPLIVSNFRILFDYDYSNFTPTLTYPTNGSTLSFNFPPQVSNINFTWTPIGSSGYQIQVAEDAGFSLIEVDTTTTNNYSVQAMDAGTHYWRVRTYNDAGATLGNWSDTFVFAFSESTPSISGTAINGIVFEYIGGVQTPISGASVYLTNSTSTFTALTGTNGYFLFTTNISNASTYSLYAIKQGYDNSQVFAVTPVYNNVTTVNLPMRIYISPYVPNFVFEKFIVRSLFDDPYPGVTVNIFVNGNVNPSFTGTTDSMGQVVFQLIKDTYYRIELSGGGLPATITEYFYGKEEAYYITIATGFPDTGDKFNDINATLFVTEINATHANLSLYYSDNSSTTSTINFFARYYSNNTNVCADQNSGTYPVTLNCTVVMGNFTYVFGWNSTSSRYGFSQAVDVVDFKANNATKQLPGLQEKLGSDMLNWISIIGLIFVAGLFSAKSVKFGVVVVPFAAVILYWVGTLQVSALLVHIALILGILSYLRMSEQKVVT